MRDGPWICLFCLHRGRNRCEVSHWRSFREAHYSEIPLMLFLVRSCLYVKSDSVHNCTETVFIFQEILRAKSDFGALMQFDRRPMALPYLYGRRLEADYIYFIGCSPHQPTDIGLTTGSDLLKVGCNLDKFWSPSARSKQRLRPIRFHMIAIQPRFP
jgi:hypothetical protein